MTVKETDFQVPQHGAATVGNPFRSHKFAGKSALRYEPGVSILGGDLVWIQGPYPAGKFTNITIFNKVLHHFLDPGERVEVDEGYTGHPNKIVCPTNPGYSSQRRAMLARARARHKISTGA